MSANSERNLAKLDYLIFLKASVVLVTGWGIDMVHRSINSQLFLLTLKVVISTLVLISAVYSTYFMIFYDWHSPPAFSWIHDSLMTILSVLLSSVLASYLSLSFAKRLIKPLQSVAHSARKISEGQLSERVNHHHCHTIEIVRLINDFNSMAGKLEAMSDDMKKWNAAIAHELRTPVTVIQGRLQGLRDGLFANDSRQFDMLIRQTEGLSRLIDDLRVLSLSDSGQLYIYRETVHLKALLHNCVETFNSHLTASGLKPVIEAADVVCYVDEVRLRQIFIALLSNACKYADPGLLRMRCSARRSDIIITVEDEGPGIADEECTAIFEAFFRSHTSGKKEINGSGLGLAVVNAIALGKVRISRSFLPKLTR
ncbi:ATP-binding protein [Serratia marcescens]|uniref:ATP-binding protein n=1 Tax=Serratia marcescens TaxID=615 RepID=UPI001F06E4BC|nr:ATP-binding protein [Serratia marcescens]UMK44256.1 ATP-binding protein [Serratia marcescens]